MVSNAVSSSCKNTSGRHPFYIEDRDNQPTLRPPHCYATTKEEEEIGRLLGDADSITRTARELFTAQALRDEKRAVEYVEDALSSRYAIESGAAPRNV